MTRDEQIRKASHSGDNNVHAEPYPIPGVTDMFNGYFATCFELGAKWADQHPNWIPVEEELPPASCGVISDPVLVFIGNNKGWCGYIREGFYNHAAKEWSYMNRGRTHKVTHWMPIVPPKKGSEQCVK